MNLQRTLQLDVVHIYYTEFSPKASFFENKHIHFAKCGAALAQEGPSAELHWA